jgi:Peptidase family M28
MYKRLFTAIFATQLLIVTIKSQDLNLVNRLEKHVTILASDSLGGRGFGFPEQDMAVDYIINQYKSAGFATLGENYLHPFEYQSGIGFTEGENIIGIIEGSDPVLKNEYIILGAHYDHLGWKTKKGKKVIYNGADDNASGVATIIEIGKILMSKRADLKRSVIIVAFDGEESGLIGSEAFASQKTVDPKKIKVMFSIDMVGMFSKNKGVDVNGSNSIKDGEKLVSEVAAREKVKVDKTDNHIEMRTDTWSFGRRYIPAIYIATGLNSPYHKPEDDSDLLDYEGMSEIVKLVSSISSELAVMEIIEPNRSFIKRSVNPWFIAGFTISTGRNYHLYKSMFYNSKSVIALETGITAQMKISKNLRIQPALTYEMTGSNADAGKFRMHSISPQIDLLLTTPSEDLSRPTGFVSIGGFYRHNFKATRSGSSFDFSGQFRSNENGLKLGAGVFYNKIQISYIYKYGLSEANCNDTDGSIYNRSSYMSVVKFF